MAARAKYNTVKNEPETKYCNFRKQARGQQKHRFVAEKSYCDAS